MCRGCTNSASSPGSKGGTSGLTGVWVLFVSFPAVPMSQGAGQISFSRGLGLPTKLMETNSLSSPGTQEARAACPVEI